MEENMRTVLINFSECTSKTEFHNEIKNSLNLPDWYGANLDALWDILTGMIELPTQITIEYLPKEAPSKETLTAFRRIVDTFIDASKEINDLSVIINSKEKF